MAIGNERPSLTILESQIGDTVITFSYAINVPAYNYFGQVIEGTEHSAEIFSSRRADNSTLSVYSGPRFMDGLKAFRESIRQALPSDQQHDDYVDSSIRIRLAVYLLSYISAQQLTRQAIYNPSCD